MLKCEWVLALHYTPLVGVHLIKKKMLPRTKFNCTIRRSAHNFIWPTSENPSPYEIFGMTPKTFNKKHLQERYVLLAKLYHPDMDRKGSDLSRSEKIDRFKRVVEAHDILKDDAKRRAWEIKQWNYETGMPRSRSSHPTPGFSQSYAYNYTANNAPGSGQTSGFTYPNAEQKFRSGLMENRIFLAKFIVASMIIVLLIELATLNKSSDVHRDLVERVTHEVEVRHLTALNNYHMDQSRDGRIKRFVAHRQATLDTMPNLGYRGLLERNSSIMRPSASRRLEDILDQTNTPQAQPEPALAITGPSLPAKDAPFTNSK